MAVNGIVNSKPRFKRGDRIRHRKTGESAEIYRSYLSYINMPPTWRYQVKKAGNRYAHWYEWAVVEEKD
jgi:hypothetical protein